MSRAVVAAACGVVCFAASASATFAAPSTRPLGCRPHVHGITIHGRILNVCGRVVQVVFTDAEHGWVLSIGNCALDLGVYAYRTTDAGRNWRKTSIRLTVNCAAGSTAYLRARGGSAEALVVATSANGCGSSFVRTFDGGASWTAPRELPLCGGDLLLTGRHGWYAGAFFADQLPLFETSSGGGTWKAERRLPKPPGFHRGWFCFSAEPELTATSGEIRAVVGWGSRAVRAVYTTRNGGRSWTLRVAGRATLPIPGSGRTGGPLMCAGRR